jgi:hypothetical protein
MEPKVSRRSISSKFAIEAAKNHPLYKCETSSYFCGEYGRLSDNNPNYDMLERLIPNQKTLEIQVTKYELPSLEYLHTDFLGFISCIFDIEVNIVIGLDKGYSTMTVQHYETNIVHQVFFSQWIILLFLFLHVYPHLVIPIQILLLMQLFSFSCTEICCNVWTLCIVYSLQSINTILAWFAMIVWIIAFIQYLKFDMTNRLLAASIHKLVKNETIRIENNDLIIL